MLYQDKVRAAFEEACGESADGAASAADMTKKMREKGWLSPLDTVIDISDILREIGIAR